MVPEEEEEEEEEEEVALVWIERCNQQQRDRSTSLAHQQRFAGCQPTISTNQTRSAHYDRPSG